jgi:hypothetical protein
MIQKFQSKKDINGNSDYLTIDHDKKIYFVNQFPGLFSSYMTLTKRDFKLMIAECKMNLYTRK